MSQNPKMPTEFQCKNNKVYTSICDFIKNKTGPWKDCIGKMSILVLENLHSSCVNTMCALEGDKSQLNYRCLAFEEMTDKCLKLSSVPQTNWRAVTNCSKFNLNKKKIFRIFCIFSKPKVA